MASLKNLAEGKPLRSPLHPAIVHLPIALFPIGVLLDFGSWMCPTRDFYLVRGAFYCLVAGLATGLLAGVFGFVDYSDIRRDHPARKTATRHMVLNLVALALFAVSAALRYDHLEAVRTAALPLWISVAALAVLSYSGYLGGHLVYSDGVGVGRHRREPPMPDETIAARADAGGMASVAESSALAEGATLRVDVAGTIVALARVDGQVHAFQEFCTHRFGPLSEGALRGCEVICPWHNSRFDIRTGRVTAGPAKVDLRTFRAEERDGRIWLEVPRA
ncbi:MAG TPA: DUF2231 domain-containing protein [Opitutus sp.]|nr:DUF2231 domain-containing protein [Opitutus sp.]